MSRRGAPGLDVYAIADLHLPFGPVWADRDAASVLERWRERVPDEALVLLAGDQCELAGSLQAHQVYQQLHDLPGAHKLLVPGNHDWPTGRSSRLLRRACGPYSSLRPLVGTATRLEISDDFGVVVAGTCGAWPGMNGGGLHSPCYTQEWHRLKSALAAARQLRGPRDALVVILHYPPFVDHRTPSSMVRLLEGAHADLCVYGHVHDPLRWPQLFQGRHGPTQYRFVASDYLHGPQLTARVTRRGLRLLA